MKHIILIIISIDFSLHSSQYNYLQHQQQHDPPQVDHHQGVAPHRQDGPVSGPPRARHESMQNITN